MSGHTFASLCGKHTFSGCEIIPGSYQQGGCCLFTLDGVTYAAVEDPDDGYRSYCLEPMIAEQKPRYSFPAIDVFCHMQADDGGGHNNVLIVRDAKNGKIVLQVGTRNTDDYYPYCWFEYTPENMECNQ